MVVAQGIWWCGQRPDQNRQQVGYQNHWLTRAKTRVRASFQVVAGSRQQNGERFWLLAWLPDALARHARPWPHLLVLVLVGAGSCTPPDGKSKASKSAKELFAKTPATLAAARAVLFGARDVVCGGAGVLYLQG
jgi:hypothetical protein